MPPTPKGLADHHFALGHRPPGPGNAITDVAGVRVGHATRIRGENIRSATILADEGRAMAALFPAVVEAVEEAVLNCAATTPTGRDGHVR